MTEIAGTPGNDLIDGTADDDVIRGLGGNDRLRGRLGNDEIHGGDGDDTVTGNEGDDVLYGEAGFDKINGNDGNDTAHGGDKADRIYGHAGNDILNGDSGNDTIYGGLDNDTIDGGRGIDRLYGDEGDDLIHGGGENDKLFGGDGQDELHGDDGNDGLNGKAGDDILYGGAGNDSLNGNIGDDVLHGDDGTDRLYGHEGTDTLNGGSGNDFLFGGDGSDTMTGGADDDFMDGGDGADNIQGDDGADIVKGRDGNDILHGGTGDDTVNGGRGDDLVIGGAGNDKLVGGAGSDSFVFGVNGGQDRIVDFVFGNDQIDLTALGLISGTETNADAFAKLEIVDLGGDVQIKLANGDAAAFSIRIEGRQADQFGIDDFVFENGYALSKAPVYRIPSQVEFNENQSGVVYTADAWDPDGDGLVFSLSGADQDLFQLDRFSGEVRFKTAPNFEKPGDINLDNRYSIKVTASDGYHEKTQKVSIKVSDVDDLSASLIIGAGGTDQIGDQLSFIGDIDGDGIVDLLIGGSRDHQNGESTIPRAGIISGAHLFEDDDQPLDLANTDLVTWFFAENGTDFQYQISVANGGDVDGDGINEILIGSGFADPDGVEDAGETYLIWGKSATADIDLSNLGSAGLLISGIEGQTSGWSVASAGDVDGDGLDDILIGASGGWNRSDTYIGETYLLWGSALASDDDGHIDLGQLGAQGLRISAANTYDGFGWEVSSAGDVDNDGLADILLSAPWADQSVEQAGEVYLIWGASLSAQESDELSIDDVAALGVTFRGVEGALGLSMDAAGDLDGDGLADLILSAPYEDDGSNSNAGATYVVWGSALANQAGTLIDFSNLDSADGLMIIGSQASEIAGHDISAAGDVDGDGLDDILIGALGNQTVYLVWGSTLAATDNLLNLDDLQASGVVINNIDGGDRLGYAVTGIGDIDQDGFDDIAVGAPGARRDGEKYVGEIYVLSGAELASDTDGLIELREEVANLANRDAWSYDDISDYLRDGFWTDTNQSARKWVFDEDSTLTFKIGSLTQQGKNLARAALDLWSDVTGIQFEEVSGGGNIEFTDNKSGAYTTHSVSGGAIRKSTVNISEAVLAEYGTQLDTYSFQIYLHEIGHALGLGHAGDYDRVADYQDDALYSNDSWQATIMSYFSQDENSTISASRAFVVSPQIADILAIQTLYGVPDDVRSGDTVYGYNSNADRSIFFAAAFPADTGPARSYTIFDSSGTDTLDYSAWSGDQILSLRPGTYSDVDGSKGNVGIALGTIIENAIGGAGDDVMIGNDVANRLTGNNGDDLFIASGGIDHIYGGHGNDTFLVSGDEADYLVKIFAGGSVRVSDLRTNSPDGVTWLDGVENIEYGGMGSPIYPQTPISSPGTQSHGSTDGTDYTVFSDVITISDGGFITSPASDNSFDLNNIPGFVGWNARGFKVLEDTIDAPIDYAAHIAQTRMDIPDSFGKTVPDAVIMRWLDPAKFTDFQNAGTDIPDGFGKSLPSDLAEFSHEIGRGFVKPYSNVDETGFVVLSDEADSADRPAIMAPLSPKHLDKPSLPAAPHDELDTPIEDSFYWETAEGW
jgi:Ca2+-binding RTX toxin-like protein